jgi:LPXTG-site transpeptidase (sortase) family protein
MNRLVSALGTLLVLAGLALLAYVGLSYARSVNGSSHKWSSSQVKKGKSIATRLSGHQTVAVPRSLGQGATAAPAGPALRMSIAKITVDSPVVQTQPVNGTWNVADWAVGHLATTPNPGVPGNGAYAAHDDIKGEIFKRLGELSPGDTIRLYTRHTLYRYVVVRQVSVDPSDVAVLKPTSQPTITLITCVPYWVDTQRLVVQAVLKSSSPTP